MQEVSLYVFQRGTELGLPLLKEVLRCTDKKKIYISLKLYRFSLSMAVHPYEKRVSVVPTGGHHLPSPSQPPTPLAASEGSQLSLLATANAAGSICRGSPTPGRHSPPPADSASSICENSHLPPPCSRCCRHAPPATGGGHMSFMGLPQVRLNQYNYYNTARRVWFCKQFNQL